MAKNDNDFYEVIYIILSELYVNLKHGTKADIRSIDRERFNIDAGYFAEILYYLDQKKYVTGLNAHISAAGTKLINIKAETRITPKGIAYLETDPVMKQYYEKYKNKINPVPGV